MAKISLSGVEAAEAPKRYFNVDRRGVIQEQAAADSMAAMTQAFEALGYSAELVPQIIEGIQILTADRMPEDKAIEMMLAAARSPHLRGGPVGMARHIVTLRKAIR